MSFSAFADGSDETVLDGYHVDDVPYNANFDSVLTASDSGSQSYFSSENKTYKTKDVLSVPATSSAIVYSFKSVTSLISWNLWRGSGSPDITFPVSGSYKGVKYVWPDSTAGSETNKTFNHQNEQSRFLKLRAGRKYRISFDFKASKFAGEFYFYLANEKTPTEVFLPLLNLRGYNTNFNSSYTVEFTVPEGNVVLIPVVKGLLGRSGNGYSGTEIAFYINDFTITDITTEDLDNSLGKFGDKIKGFFDNLVESIKGFFIPKEGFFDDVKSRFDKLLSEHLGFLYEAPSMVGSIFGVVKDWSPPEQPTITLPAFNFDIGNDHIHLWDEQVYTFDFLSNQPWSTLYAFYKTFIFVLLSVAMINLAIKKYHSIVGGGGLDDN